MKIGPLKDFRILVVEDEYMLAEDLCRTLQDAGAVVVGPAKSVAAALRLLKDDPAINGAVLDINLNGELVFPVADALVTRGAPFVFATAYSAEIAPNRYSFVPHRQKPVPAEVVAEALQEAMFAFLSPSDRRRRTMGLGA